VVGFTDQSPYRQRTLDGPQDRSGHSEIKISLLSLRLSWQKSRPETFESKNVTSRLAGTEKCATGCMAGSGMSVGHRQGHKHWER
jgi:hypothetical protein